MNVTSSFIISLRGHNRIYLTSTVGGGVKALGLDKDSINASHGA